MEPWANFMCFGGGPQVDNTVQRQQLTEAAEARWREEQRQNRVNAGMGYLDSIFGGGTMGADKLGKDAVFDPNATYYMKSGEAWTPLGKSDVWQDGSNLGDFQLPDAQKQFQEALKNGLLYSGTKEATGFNDDFFDQRRNDFLGYYQPQLDDQFGKARDQLTFALARAGTLNSTLAADKQGDLSSQYDVQRGSILSQADADVAAQRARINQEKSGLVAQLNATGDADRVSNEALARTQQMFNERPTYNPLGDIFSGVAAGIGNWHNAQQNRNAWNTYNQGRSGGGFYMVN